jgi:hypothetical protein
LQSCRKKLTSEGHVAGANANFVASLFQAHFDGKKQFCHKICRLRVGRYGRRKLTVRSAKSENRKQLMGGQPIQIGLGHGNLPAESAMLANVRQIGTAFRIGMQSGFHPTAVSRFPIVKVVGPNGGLFHHQSIAIRIEFVGHGKQKIGWLWDFNADQRRRAKPKV